MPHNVERSLPAVTPETLSILALISFGFGAVAAFAGFRFEAWRNNAIQLTAVGLGMAFKTAAIGLGCVVANNHLFNSSSEIYGLLAWALGFSLLVALAVSAARSLSAVILPIVVVLMILALFSSHQAQDTGAPPGRLFSVHLLTAFLGYGLFLTACGASVLYLEQASLLKRKIFGAIFKDLPSLERLERLELLCAWLGLIAFSIAIATGAVLANAAGKAFWTEPKYLSSLMTWAIFGALAIGRAAHWLNGRSAARFVLAGAGLVLVTLALSHGFERPQNAAGNRQTTEVRRTDHFSFLISHFSFLIGSSAKREIVAIPQWKMRNQKCEMRNESVQIVMPGGLRA
jgi:ABC-type uncharacterized transport system permease subunit